MNWIDDINTSKYPGSDPVADKARAEVNDIPSPGPLPMQTAEEAARRWLEHREAIENPGKCLTHKEWHRQMMERVTWR